MAQLKEIDISKSYKKIVKFAEKAFLNGDYEDCLGYIETASNLAYSFNIIYTDVCLEKLLTNICSKVLLSSSINPIGKRIILHDVFGLANRGLTQQYLRAFVKLGYEILYILENKSNYSDAILDELSNYEKATIYLVDSKDNKIDKIKKISQVITDYRPEKAFLHLHPSSVVAVVVWNNFKDIIRYQINLTDHAFWLGVNCINYSLEFRDYGCTVSVEKRGINKEKILIQPYYPILDCAPFAGLPKGLKEKTLIFTGGAYYKMYGDNNEFFKILIGLVTRFQNVVILIAGEGNQVPLEQFIKENNFENKILLIGKRTDINHIFVNTDIYLSTYPITGGLMAQFAAVNGKPILSYSPKDIPCNDVDSLLTINKDSYRKLTHDSHEAFFNYAKLLIDDKFQRQFEGDILRKRVITVDGFAELLAHNLDSHDLLEFETVVIDYKRFVSLYLEVANKYIYNFHLLILKRFRIKAFLYFPKYFFDKKVLKLIFINAKRKIKGGY